MAGVRTTPKKRTEITNRLGKIVRVRREALNLSQESFAEKVGLSKNYIGTIERGEQEMSVTVMVQIGAALKCSASDLLAEAGY